MIEVAPELVHEDENGYLQVDYGKLPIYTIAAIGEQQAQIGRAEIRLNAIENSIQPSSNNVLDLTNGGAIQGNLKVVGSLIVSEQVTISSLTVTDDVVVAGNLAVQGDVEVNSIIINSKIITQGDAPIIEVGVAFGEEDKENGISAPEATIVGKMTLVVQLQL